MKKSNYEICEAIVDRYVENEDLNSVSRFISLLPQLVQNNLGCMIEYSDTVGTPYANYRVAAKFIQKHNKSIKENRRLPIEFEFGERSTIWSCDNVQLSNLTKYILDNGTYFAELDNNNYCILETKIDAMSLICTSKLYFIGKDWKKWKKKYLKMVNKYKKLSKLDRNEMIVSNGIYINTIFKSFDNVIMKDKEKVINYIDNWVECIPTYYNKYNMIPKLSILLYGEPGTGKSTFYKALAKYLHIDRVTIIDKMTLTSQNRRNSASTVYAIDDIDCICESRSSKSSNSDNSSTLSKLLEFLDNPPTFRYLAKDGIEYPVQIVVATTNYYDKLDPAVKRYGRFDLQIKMGNFDEELAQKMCDLYGLKLSNLIGYIGKNFKISPSKLQAMCLTSVDSKIKNNLEHKDGRILIHRIK